MSYPTLTQAREHWNRFTSKRGHGQAHRRLRHVRWCVLDGVPHVVSETDPEFAFCFIFNERGRVTDLPGYYNTDARSAYHRKEAV